MDEAYNKIRSVLKSSNVPDYPSMFPREMRTSEIEEHLTLLYKSSILEVQNNPEALPILVDFVGLPLETNLDEMAIVLKEEMKSKCSNCAQNQGLITDIDSDTMPIKNEFKSANCGVGESSTDAPKRGTSPMAKKQRSGENVDDESKIEQHILERIQAEILNVKLDVKWEDVVGLECVKKNINEIIIWPMLRPDIFQGLRGPPKGLMLFGPPGTGKTLIGKCIASQINSTFFSISSSSLTSKWVGEGEKMVKALFYLARKMQPSVIFVDEIDSLLSQRTEQENEGSRRIKTEFLVQFDGVGTGDNDKILLIGATNRPQEIDEAARRRLVKRIYVPLPKKTDRIEMIRILIKDFNNSLTEEELGEIADRIDGYSGSDIFNLCREASLEPLRELKDIQSISAGETRAISCNDFLKAIRQIRKSVSTKDLDAYEQWNEKYGSTY